MTVRYSLSRSEVASGYLYGWRYSCTFRRQMLLMAVLVGAMPVGSGFLQRDVVGSGDIFKGALWAVAAVLSMPVWLALTAKTQERVLELAPDGIKTTIGRRIATLPWATISFIGDVGPFVVIGRKSMNAFLVPNRAFADDQARERFIADAQAWAQRVNGRDDR